jgi:hypothetical protein
MAINGAIQRRDLSTVMTASPFKGELKHGGTAGEPHAAIARRAIRPGPAASIPVPSGLGVAVPGSAATATVSLHRFVAQAEARAPPFARRGGPCCS